uniref:Uncharacterized protein n=1 Tax=Rhizophora mucronata TaxID=61149 RepID=A0A2P2N706_RHIMU
MASAGRNLWLCRSLRPVGLPRRFSAWKWRRRRICR